MSPAAPLQVDQTVYVEVYDSHAHRNVFVPGLVKGKQREANPTRPKWVAVELVYTVGDGNEYGAGDVIARPPSALYQGQPEAGAASPYIDGHLRDLPEVRIVRYRIVPGTDANQMRGT